MQSDAQPHRTSPSTRSMIGEESVRRCHHEKREKRPLTAMLDIRSLGSCAVGTHLTAVTAGRRELLPSAAHTLAPGIAGACHISPAPPFLYCTMPWMVSSSATLSCQDIDCLWLPRRAPLLCASAPCPQLASEKRSPWAKRLHGFWTQHGAPPLLTVIRAGCNFKPMSSLTARGPR